MNPAQPPEGILDPQQPYWPADRVGEVTWLRLKGKLTGRRVEGLSENFTSYVKLGDADADRLIANIKKWGKYPQVNQNDKYGGAYNNEAYQKWLVEEFLEKPFREQVDQKIEDRQAARRIADILNKKQAAQLTADVIEDPWGEATAPPKQYAVVPTTKLLPPAKEVKEEQKPEAKKKRGSSLVKSMTKTFARMETHFQKLSELSEVSEGNITEIADAFRIQSDALTKGFQDTTTLITKVTQAVDLQSSTMVRIAKGKKDLDQKRLDAQEALNEEVALEQQQTSSGNVKAEDIGKGSGPGGGVGGSIAKVLGGAVIGKVLAGQGLKLAKGVGGKTASKISGKVLEKALGKETAEAVLKNAGREAAETGVEKGAAKLIGKRIPLVGLGIGTFLALERAAKGDFLGAGLELASGAASTIPGGGTAASLGIDAALMARDSGMLPFEKGGLTQKSTFSTKRPGVTDLSPALFKKMYQYEIDYEARNKIKFGRLYAEGYQKYFDSPGLLSKLSGFLSNVVLFFKEVATRIGNILANAGRALRNLLPDPSITRGMTASGGDKATPFIYSRYGMRDGKMHNGLDISGGPWQSGAPISVIKPGKVIDVGDLSKGTGDPSGWGNFVVIQHDDGSQSLYGHLSQINVSKGDVIENKDGNATIIGKVGNTGASQGAHLHFELGSGWTGGTLSKHMNPEPYIDEYVRAGGKVSVKATTGDARQVTPASKVGSGKDDYSYEPTTEAGRNKENKLKPNQIELQIPGFGGKYFVLSDRSNGKFEVWEKGLLGFIGNKPKVVGSGRKDKGKLKDPLFAAAYNEVRANYMSSAPQSGRDYGYITDAEYKGVIQARNSGETSPELTGTDFSPEGRAGGGPVIAGVPYKVGEKGEELFIPKQDGFIMNNQQTAGLVDFIDKMIFGGPTGKPVSYPTSPPKRRYYAADESGAEILRTLGGTPVRGAMMENQLNKLVAMASLEDEMTSRIHIISVNNTVTVPVPTSSDSSDDTTPAGNIFRDLHLASIS